MMIEYREHELSYVVIGDVDSVSKNGRAFILENCFSTPGDGVGFALDPSDVYLFRLKVGVEPPAVGAKIAVRTPLKLDDCYYGNCWWFPVT